MSSPTVETHVVVGVPEVSWAEFDRDPVRVIEMAKDGPVILVDESDGTKAVMTRLSEGGGDA